MKTIQLIKIILSTLLIFSLQVQTECFAETQNPSRLTKIKNFFDRQIPSTLRPNYFYNTGFIKYVKFPLKFTFKNNENIEDLEYEIRSTGINIKNAIFQYNIYKDGKFYATAAGDVYYDNIRFSIPVDVFSEHGELNTYQCFAPIKKNGELKGVCNVIAKNEDGVPEMYVDEFVAVPLDNIKSASIDEQDADSIGSNHKFKSGLASKQNKLSQ